jgi:hypothetical protein
MVDADRQNLDVKFVSSDARNLCFLKGCHVGEDYCLAIAKHLE